MFTNLLLWKPCFVVILKVGPYYKLHGGNNERKTTGRSSAVPFIILFFIILISCLFFFTGIYTVSPLPDDKPALIIENTVLLDDTPFIIENNQVLLSYIL